LKGDFQALASSHFSVNSILSKFTMKKFKISF
jgi:hypothetical protein